MKTKPFIFTLLFLIPGISIADNYVFRYFSYGIVDNNQEPIIGNDNYSCKDGDYRSLATMVTSTVIDPNFFNMVVSNPPPNHQQTFYLDIGYQGTFDIYAMNDPTGETSLIEFLAEGTHVFVNSLSKNSENYNFLTENSTYINTQESLGLRIIRESITFCADQEYVNTLPPSPIST